MYLFYIRYIYYDIDFIYCTKYIYENNDSTDLMFFYKCVLPTIYILHRDCAT